MGSWVLSGSLRRIFALVSETKPTLAKDRSWPGYKSGARKTRSPTKRTSSRLRVAVIELHSDDPGLGSPNSSV